MKAILLRGLKRESNQIPSKPVKSDSAQLKSKLRKKYTKRIHNQ